MVSLNAAGILDQVSLDLLVIEIKQQHSITLYRMRNYLTASIVAGLQAKGMTTGFDENGFISVANRGGIEYKIWTTPRPPRVNDYHYSDISNPMGKKVIVGPEFKEDKRGTLNSWLSHKSNVKFYNEGEILTLCDSIYP